MKKQDKAKLEMWKKRLSANQERYDVFAVKFEHREALFRGAKAVTACCEGDTKTETPHVRNIVAELIESQVDTSIPMPKVKARHKEDEQLAMLIEDMIMDELDRLPIEELNDMMERTTPLQGGSLFWLEWDHFIRTHTTMGEITLKVLHPKQIVPQDGVYDSIESMDFIIVKLPQTKEYIKRRYGVSVHDEDEEEPEIRSFDDATAASDLVTQYIGYYRNDNNGIGLFSWVNDIVLEDMEDYQARRLQRCKKCNAVAPADVTHLDAPSMDGNHPYEKRDVQSDWELDNEKPRSGGNKTICPYCGSTQFESVEEEYETITYGKVSAHGVEIPGEHLETITDENGLPMQMPMPTKVPYYKPDIYPILLQKNVSVFGQLLGDSDADKIESQQNTLNRLSAKYLDMAIKGGSFLVLPPDARIDTSNEDMKLIRIDEIKDKQMIDAITAMPEPEYFNSILNFYANTYEEGRQSIGITDSFQGRQDPTATSGKAKEFAAQQSAGRLESKRVMKEALYQRLFEAIFKFMLAYADEPRTIRHKGPNGETQYDVFDRYDFLKQDAAGEWYWNDQFIFSVDSATPLAKDREAMWQELRMNLQSGAFGDPTDIDTLILFWQKMAEQHYPMAEETKEWLEDKKANDMLLAQQQAMQQQQMQAQAMEADANARAAEAEAHAVENIMKEVNRNGSTKAQEKNGQQ